MPKSIRSRRTTRNDMDHMFAMQKETAEMYKDYPQVLEAFSSFIHSPVCELIKDLRDHPYMPTCEEEQQK